MMTSTVSNSGDMLDHIYGTLYGQCVGDTIGLLTEFMTKEQAKKTYGQYKELEFEHKVPDMHRMRWKVGDWTDDSDQMILIIESLLDNNGKIDIIDFAQKVYIWTTRGYRELGDYVGMGIGSNTDLVVKHKDFKTSPHAIDAVDFGNRLLNWARKGFPEFGDLGGMGIGATTSHVLKDEKFTTNPHAAAEDIWTRSGRVVAPNGAVMRTSVLGIHQYEDLEAVAANATSICKTTHADPRCVASCVAVSTAVAYMMQRQDKHLLRDGQYNINAIINDSYIAAKPCLAGKHYKKYKKDLKHHMFAKNIKDLHLDESKAIGYTYKTMGAGFWALRQTDFRVALQCIVFEGGDADTNGAVAGALLGCKLGSSQLPPSWRDKLLHKDWLDAKITRFLDLESRLKTGAEDTSAASVPHETSATSAETPVVPEESVTTVPPVTLDAENASSQ